MRNKFEVRGDTTAIFIDSPKHGRMETLIATSDSERAQEFTGTWGAYWCPGTRCLYVRGEMRIGGKRKTIHLHRWILSVTDSKLHVDHVLHDTLDNCRWALNVVTNAENHQNQRRNRNNTSGVTGVHYDQKASKWKAQINANGRRKHIGFYDTLAEAAEARAQAEAEHYKYKQKIS